MTDANQSEAKPSKPGDPYIAFGNALNCGDTTIEQLVKLALECGLILSFSVELDPEQSLDVAATLA